MANSDYAWVHSTGRWRRARVVYRTPRANGTAIVVYKLSNGGYRGARVKKSECFDEDVEFECLKDFNTAEYRPVGFEKPWGWSPVSPEPFPFRQATYEASYSKDARKTLESKVPGFAERYRLAERYRRNREGSL